MNKNDAVMVRARRVDPARDAYEDLARSAGAQETLTAIVQTPVPARQPSEHARAVAHRARIRRRVALLTTAVAAAVAVAVAAVTVLAPADRPGNGRDEPVWSAELLSVAEGSPRLLLDPQEWKVTRADEVSGEMGEMIFQNGRDCDLLPLKKGCYAVTLHWRPASTHGQYFEDRKRGSDASSEITIDGNKAAVFAHHGMAFGTTFYAMWLDGPHSLELRSDVVPTLDEFNAIAVSLHEVDAEAWLAVMPSGAVTPVERSGAIDELLGDTPVPDNVDLDALRNSARVSDENALRYEVELTVVCGWVQQWADARAAHDSAAEREAVEAMGGARDWPLMKGQTWALSNVIDVAEAMADDAKLAGSESLPIATGYQRHLGCHES